MDFTSFTNFCFQNFLEAGGYTYTHTQKHTDTHTHTLSYVQQSLKAAELGRQAPLS